MGESWLICCFLLLLGSLACRVSRREAFDFRRDHGSGGLTYIQTDDLTGQNKRTQKTVKLLLKGDGRERAMAASSARDQRVTGL